LNLLFVIVAAIATANALIGLLQLQQQQQQEHYQQQK
jgi:hypothetical protein